MSTRLRIAKERPGRICGDPTNGLCERVVIEVPRVLDGCTNIVPSENFVVRLDAMTPNLAPPFVFVDLVSEGPATLTDVQIHRTSCDKSRINCIITVPVRCRYLDSAGVEGVGHGALVERREVVLYVPDIEAMPTNILRRTTRDYEVRVRVAINSTSGSFVSNDTVVVSCCVMDEFEVVGIQRLLVPAYGDFEFPQCRLNNPCGL